MSKQKNGGPAFPRAATWSPSGSQLAIQQDGMTLRDYFANSISADGLSKSCAELLMQESAPTGEYSMIHLEWWAQAESKYKYFIAEKMLNAREVQP